MDVIWIVDFMIIQSLIMDHMDGHDAFYVWLILIMFIKIKRYDI